MLPVDKAALYFTSLFYTHAHTHRCALFVSPPAELFESGRKPHGCLCVRRCVCLCARMDRRLLLELVAGQLVKWTRGDPYKASVFIYLYVCPSNDSVIFLPLTQAVVATRGCCCSQRHVGASAAFPVWRENTSAGNESHHFSAPNGAACVPPYRKPRRAPRGSRTLPRPALGTFRIFSLRGCGNPAPTHARLAGKRESHGHHLDQQKLATKTPLSMAMIIHGVSLLM